MDRTHSSEREALRRLVESGAFSRAPNLEKILLYVCEKYFRGEANHLKEFHIATEGLGRPDSFDPKKDSIVRVEVHRLRKRLRDHYEKFPSDPVRIILPEKSYVPEFQFVAESPSPAIPVVEVPHVAATETAVPVRSPVYRWTSGILAACAIAIGLGYWVIPAVRGEGSASAGGNAIAAPNRASSVPAAPVPEPVDTAPLPAGSEIRILAGRPPGRYVDRYGVTWEGDKFFKGGEALPVSAEIRSAGWDTNLFAAMREGNFEYEIPLQPGSYELTLLFAETALGEGRPLGSDTHRVFSITANDKPLLTSFDVLSDSIDPNTAWTRRFKDLQPGEDGKLHLKFFRASGTKPFINALALTPGTKGRMRTLRMVCRNQTFVDSNGVRWEPEHYYHGGTQITRPHGAAAGDHFQGERFGYFSYTIPVPQPGKYGARLYFWEYWWGPEQPGKGGAGSRVFDVFCNFKPLLVGFDIIKRSGRDQTVVETFHGLEPDVRGVLKFDFTAKANYALINAIEIFDETP